MVGVPLFFSLIIATGMSIGCGVAAVVAWELCFWAVGAGNQFEDEIR